MKTAHNKYTVNGMPCVRNEQIQCSALLKRLHHQRHTLLNANLSQYNYSRQKSTTPPFLLYRYLIRLTYGPRTIVFVCLFVSIFWSSHCDVKIQRSSSWRVQTAIIHRCHVCKWWLLWLHSCVIGDPRLLHDTGSLGACFPTFRKNLLPSLLAWLKTTETG